MNKKYIKRGAILRCTSGATKGHYYLFVRTMGGQDKTFDFLGNELPGMNGATSYTYNLVNVTDIGKARQTEVDRQFVTTCDGVTWGVSLDELVAHFGIGLEDVTDVASVNVQIKEILDQKHEEKQVEHILDMAKVLMSLVNGDVKIVPISGDRVLVHGMRFAQ